jgi:hypothetical protein
MKILEQIIDGKIKRTPIKSDGGGKIKRTPIKSDGGGKIKREPIVTPTDNTTIPYPPDNTDKVDQTSNVELPPSKNDKYKIWIQHSHSGREFNRPEFVKAIENAYLDKDKKQDVY